MTKLTPVSPRMTELDGTTPVQLDLSDLRAHMQVFHRNAKLPRANAHLAVLHARLHTRYHCSTHHHEGDRRLIRNSGITVEYELNNYTGKGVVTKEAALERVLAQQIPQDLGGNNATEPEPAVPVTEGPFEPEELCRLFGYHGWPECTQNQDELDFRPKVWDEFRVAEQLIRAEHRTTDYMSPFWSEIADLFNKVASDVEHGQVGVYRSKPSWYDVNGLLRAARNYTDDYERRRKEARP